MKLTVRKIARVDKAVIEIRGITVMTGANGSGKSTVSKSLYSILETGRELPEKVLAEKRNSFIYRLRENDNYSKYCNRILFLLQLWRPNPDIFPVSFFIPDPNFRKEDLKRHLDKLSGRKHSAEYTREQEEEILSGIAGEIREIAESPDSRYYGFIAEKTLNDVFCGQFSDLRSPKGNGSIELTASNARYRIAVSDNKVTDYVPQGDFRGNVWYLDARHLLDEEYPGQSTGRQLAGTGHIQKIKGSLMSARTDISLEESNERKEAVRVFDDLLSGVLSGKLEAERSGIMYKEEKIDVPIDVRNVASGLKTVLLIRRLIENGYLSRGDVFIIDEPEMNLHPEWQVILAEFFVQMTDQLGIRMLLNSHSPYFVRAVEVKLAGYGLADSGRYYLMQENETGGMEAEDVTQKTELIYKKFYLPLEQL